LHRHLSSAEDYTNMTYYNLCGIKSKHKNISKGRGYILQITGMQESNSQLEADRNKYLTWNRCPLGNCE